MKIARVALVVPAVLLVAACGTTTLTGGQDSTTATSAPAAEPPGTPEGLGSADNRTADLSTTSSGGSAETTDATSTEEPQTKAVISTGQVEVHSDDIDKARFDLRKMLDTWGGEISDEDSRADDQGRTRMARLELRVPVKKFDTAMNDLPGLGSLVSRSRSSKDVTTKVIDTQTRVRSQKLSLARIQALLDQATSLDQVISIEAQLSRRQADLDSLERQQAYLADQTAQATITLYLSRPDDGGETGPAKDDKGFISGLKSGWDHLGTATTNVLDTTGTALPFALVLLAVGLPVISVGKRRARARSAA